MKRLSLFLLILAVTLPAAHAQIIGLPEANDRFGQAVATGDFDGDGFDDLAVGVPAEDVGDLEDSGAVNVVYGTSSGLDDAGNQIWDQGTPGVALLAEAYDRFGGALAAGDFDGDGFDDLAIGVSSEDIGDIWNAGVVFVLYGTASGLTATGSQIWDQGKLAPSTPEPGDYFGQAVATGDFDGDGFDDLAIGAAFENTASGDGAGIVHILFGSSGALTSTGSQTWTRESAGAGSAETFDRLGYSLAAGRFGTDGFDDLAIGMPGYSPGEQGAAGGVLTLYGSGSGLQPNGIIWSQAMPEIEGIAETGDFFGSALAVGDFGGDGDDDLAIGVPFEGVFDLADVGAINILYSSNVGLTSTNNRIFHPGDGITDNIPEAFDRFGDALTAGDFNGDGADDLGVGVPYEHVGTVPDAGAVYAYFGTLGTGITGSGRSITQDQPRGIRDQSESGDLFGQFLSVGDFDGDGRADAAIGAPGEDVNLVSNAGAVNVLSFSLNQFLHQGGALRIENGESTGLFALEDAPDAVWYAPNAAEGGAVEDGAEAPTRRSSALPSEASLTGNYPNPFTQSTTVGFAVPSAQRVRLAVYDVLGREVARLVDGEVEAGRHEATLDGAGLPSGVYLVRLAAENRTQTQRLTLVR